MVKARKIGFFFIVFLLSSCSEKESKAKVEPLTYFDVKGYFEKEAHRLSEQGAFVFKEIRKNQKKETKRIRINDWNKEFTLFTESDINKPSWVSSYSVETDKDTLIYTSLDPELRTKEIKVVNKSNKVQFLSITNEVVNKLYQSQEKLIYLPDSVYKIIKNQQVQIIGENQYEVTGKFID